jgi:uncharacterized protein with PIN domain
MEMRFKIDENLPVEAAELLRSHDHDAVMVQDQGLKGCSDDHLIEVCISENRILVTLEAFAKVRKYYSKHYLPPSLHPARPLYERGPLVLRTSFPRWGQEQIGAQRLPLPPPGERD